MRFFLTDRTSGGGVLSSAPLCAARRGGLHPGMMHNAVETKTVGIAAGRLSAGLQCLE